MAKGTGGVEKHRFVKNLKGEDHHRFPILAGSLILATPTLLVLVRQGKTELQWANPRQLG